jgi:ABC-type taurine transport system substrate-binding protein
MRHWRTWRNGHELVKAVRSGHVRAALGELGSDDDVVDEENFS